MTPKTGETPAPSLRILIVEDDEELALAWVDKLGLTRGDVRVAGSIAAARRALADWDWLHGALIDYVLPDGTGVDVLEELRAKDPAPGTAIVSGYATNALRLAVRPVLVLEKPLHDADLHVLAEEVLAPRDRLQTALIDFARQYRLSPRHRQLLLCAVRGFAHEETALSLGCAVGTVKKQWQRIFDRLGLHGEMADPHLQQRVIGSLLRYVTQQQRL